MTIDSKSIFQKKETMHKRHNRYKIIIANLLYNKFEKDFKTTKTKVGNQLLTVDLMSEDKTIAVKIINSKLTTHNKINSSIFQHILSALLILSLVDSKRKILIFTNKMMYEEFCTALAVMPYPINHMKESIMILCVPLSNSSNDDEYCEFSDYCKIFEDSLNCEWGINDRN